MSLSLRSVTNSSRQTASIARSVVRSKSCSHVHKLEKSPHSRSHRQLQQQFPMCDRELWPMILTFELVLDRIATNQRAKDLRQGHLVQKVLSGHTHRGHIALPGPLKWLVKSRNLWVKVIIFSKFAAQYKYIQKMAKQNRPGAVVKYIAYCRYSQTLV